MNECKICKIHLESVRAKTCSNKVCKSKWKMERNKNLPPTEKSCQSCGNTFKTIDRRNNFCSNECRVSARHVTMLNKYGQKSITSPWNERKDKTLQTFQTLYNGSSKRFTYLQERGFSSIEELANAIQAFCKKNNVAPNSKTCLDHFNISTYMNRILNEFNLTDVLHNSYRNSQQEIEIQEFLKSLGIKEFKSNYRADFLNTKELDIYMPDKKLAIEFHGLAMHSERPIFREYNTEKLNTIKSVHEFKYLKCKEKGIKLIQIFEDEWRDKRHICESIIKNKLNMVNTIYARKTKFVMCTTQEAKEFFDKNHISGYVKSTYNFGLKIDNELVSMISYRSTWNKKYGDDTIEIARFASILNTRVVGGFSKLLKNSIKLLKDSGFEQILTYADCRFGDGEVYSKCGFDYLGKTKPNYFYEKAGVRESRFKHRKINNLELGLTEREQNNNLGWYAVYDAGNQIYLKSLVSKES